MKTFVIILKFVYYLVTEIGVQVLYKAIQTAYLKATGKEFNV